MICHSRASSTESDAFAGKNPSFETLTSTFPKGSVAVAIPF